MKKHLIQTSTIGMDKQQWLDFRVNGIGASEIGTVLGLNKYMASIELFYQKLMKQTNKKENEAMHWGKALESLVADRWQYWDGTPESYIENFNNEKIMRRMRRSNAYIQNPAHMHLFASLDRVINKNGSDMEQSLECKCIAGYVIDQWENGIPPSYVVQLQQQLLVCEFDNGELAMLKDGRYMEVLPFERNETLFATIIDQSTIFWQRVTAARDELKKAGFEYYTDELPDEVKQAVGMHEPDADGSEAYQTYLKARWRGESPERAGTAFEYELALQYKQINEAMAKLEEQKREHSNSLMKSIGDSECIDFGGGGKITWRPNKNGVRAFRVNLKEIKQTNA